MKNENEAGPLMPSLDPFHFKALEQEIFLHQENLLSSSCYRTADNLSQFLADRNISCTKVFAIPTAGHLQYTGGPLWENHVAVVLRIHEKDLLISRIIDLHLPFTSSLSWDEWQSTLAGFPESVNLHQILTIQFPSRYFCPLKKDLSTLYQNYIQE